MRSHGKHVFINIYKHHFQLYIQFSMKICGKILTMRSCFNMDAREVNLIY